MKAKRRRFHLHVCTVVMLAATAAEGRAGLITGSGGLEGLGSFSATVNYMVIDSSHATLNIELGNTSLAANGGYLTAFAFHNPLGRITGLTLSSTNSNFGPLGGPDYLNTIHAPPFGDFDLGASTSNDFLGGGSPVGGIGVGEFSTYAFALTGNGLDELTVESFFTHSPTGTGEDSHPVLLLARFRGFLDGGSDKVPGTLTGAPPVGDPPESPEPATLVLGAIAAVAGIGCRRRGRRQ